MTRTFTLGALAAVGAILTAMFATISLDDTVHARDYYPGHIVAQPVPGQLYEAVGGQIVRSPICWMERSEAVVSEPGNARFVNRMGQMMPPLVSFMSGLPGMDVEFPEEFRDFASEVYEVTWVYNTLSLAKQNRGDANADCQVELERAVAAGSCVLTIDTVLERRDEPPRLNPDGSITVAPVFAVSFRPECLLLGCVADEPCQPRMWQQIPPLSWATRVKLGMGLVMPV